ncbi:MAG: long-chain fatty acid--CoA ligase [Bacteroidia bacterium]|nr:long-chain fatty acid--CoA ligase [Bacteroidia bacterium]MDW8015807.1 long-chain fatty acid--CoA ligase [Bacteroidia bacterium]
MEIRRLHDLLAEQLSKGGRPDAIAAKKGGRWQTYSTQEVAHLADVVSRALLKFGLQKGDRIALVSPNCPEWNFVDLGAVQIGIVVVPLYANAIATDYEYIIQHSESRLLFCSGGEVWEKVKSILPRCPTIEKVYVFDPEPDATSWKDFLAIGKGDATDLTPYKENVKPEDWATFLYTSGTTGVPKGVILTHHNIVSNVLAVRELNLMPRGSEPLRALSFLPLNHSFERMVFYTYLSMGIGIYYAESLDTIRDNLLEVKPHVFTSVPRLLEKMYERIIATGQTLTGIKRVLFFWALDLVKAYDPEKSYPLSYRIQLWLARALVFRKWKEALGGNVQLIVTGAAALPKHLAHTFWGAGFFIMEGYGLTETSPVISVNTFDAYRLGSVGKPIPNVEVRIEPLEGYTEGEGEIIVRGPNVMQGYYKNPEATAEVLQDGWLRTGDVGKIDQDGFLYITDRKKELFKTAGGKYIAPQPIESALKSSIYIEQAMVVGEYRKFPAALLVPAFPALEKWAQEKGISFASREELIHHPQVIELIDSEINRINQQFSQFERVKKFILLPKEWTIEGGELTPTLKLKRRVILAQYQKAIDALYAEAETPVAR